MQESTWEFAGAKVLHAHILLASSVQGIAATKVPIERRAWCMYAM